MSISVLNCVRLLTRILPYIFEDPDWRGFFWSTLPGQSAEDAAEVKHLRKIHGTLKSAFTLFHYLLHMAALFVITFYDKLYSLFLSE